MEEKTFEELIDDLYHYEGMLFENDDFVSKNQVKELLQQVREATIAEVWEIIMNGEKTLADIKNLPTDRIKIEE